MSETVVLGGGPAGLAAAYELTKHGAAVSVIERLDRVGGLARTLSHAGCLFDIGPHRFFTKNQEVRQLFLDVMEDDALLVPRLTRILYRGRFFNYPITPVNAMWGLGPAECIRIMTSYSASTVRRFTAAKEPENFAEWMTDKFGAHLFDIFFRTYTEKVWGIPCNQIGADWAGQRIKSLSLTQAIRHAFWGPGKTVRSLVNEFLFPRLGAGQLYEKMALLVAARGGSVATSRRVVRLRRDGFIVRAVVVEDAQGNQEEFAAHSVLSSAPLTETVEMMEPGPPREVLEACRSLRYRNHIGVHLKLRGMPFRDNWIYVHSKDVQMARIANYRNFSTAMADEDGVSPVTVEYFSSPGDAISRFSDDQLIALAAAELKHTGLLKPPVKMLSGFVVRSEKAYPVIEIGFDRHVATIKAWLDQFENLIPIGRSGMFKYNNQDHAIATGLLAARNVLGIGHYDPWRVNIDAEYHEEVATDAEQPAAALSP
jgi:protoporphyrinogen oxidase